MIYIFCLNDISNDDEKNVFKLQMEYAKEIHKLAFCDLETNSIIDIDKRVIDITGVVIFLRVGVGNLCEAASLILKKGGILFETLSDIEQIKNWVKLNLHRREILCISQNDFMRDPLILPYQFQRKKVFVKSVNKGFSLAGYFDKVRNYINNMYFIHKKPSLENESVYISKYYDIARDSLGKLEARFIIIDDRIINYSRYLWGLKHGVPGNLKRCAKELVARIKELDFPPNYIMDLGVFEDEGKTFVDIVEFNPITTSYCYINNSIFEEKLPEIEIAQRKTGFGNEYTFDYLKNPDGYNLTRDSRVNYEYSRDTHIDIT